MSKQDIERIDDRGLAAWAGHSPEAFVDLLADDFVWNDSTLPAPMRTKEEARRHVQTWLTAFPDLHLQLLNRVVDEPSIGCEFEFTGTNTGPMKMGDREIPPTGKRVVGHGTYFARVKNDKIVEFNSHPDTTEMLLQLGLMS